MRSGRDSDLARIHPHVCHLCARRPPSSESIPKGASCVPYTKLAPCPSRPALPSSAAPPNPPPTAQHWPQEILPPAWLAPPTSHPRPSSLRTLAIPHLISFLFAIPIPAIPFATPPAHAPPLLLIATGPVAPASSLPHPSLTPVSLATGVSSPTALPCPSTLTRAPATNFTPTVLSSLDSPLRWPDSPRRLHQPPPSHPAHTVRHLPSPPKPIDDPAPAPRPHRGPHCRPNMKRGTS